MHLLSFCLSLLSLFSFSAYATDNSCPRCVLMREYHEKHPEENYYWYDDYLEEKTEKNDYKPKSTNSEKKLPVNPSSP